MNTSNVRILTGDNVEISATHYGAAESSSKRVAIVLCATGAQQEVYADIASFLARDGWHVLTFDYRGIGRSKIGPCDRDKLSMSAWGKEDLAAVIDWVCETFGAERVVVIAHSIGGQILPLAANRGRIDAVLAVECPEGLLEAVGRSGQVPRVCLLSTLPPPLRARAGIRPTWICRT